MLFPRGNDWGGRALTDRNWVDGFTFSVRFDFTNTTLNPGGYDLPLFVAESDAYVTIVNRVKVEHDTPLGSQMWRVGLRTSQQDLPDQARDSDFLDVEIPTPGRLPNNGFIGPSLQSELRESIYVARPDRLISLRFSPILAFWNPNLAPVGTAYIAGGRLQ